MPHPLSLAAGMHRQQHFDALADQLRAGVSEHRFELAIDQQDAAVLIDHEHAVRRAFDGYAESLVGDVRRCFDRFERRCCGLVQMALLAGCHVRARSSSSRVADREPAA
jgi:hypothetical protein